MKEAIKTCNGGEISLENIISGEITPEVIEKIKEKGEFIPRLQNQRNFFLVFVQIIIKITLSLSPIENLLYTVITMKNSEIGIVLLYCRLHIPVFWFSCFCE